MQGVIQSPSEALMEIGLVAFSANLTRREARLSRSGVGGL